MEAVPGLRRAVMSEYRRVVRPPWEIPTALVTNGALMVAAWFLLPPRAHAFMFSLNGPLAFPVILASWMLADTPRPMLWAPAQLWHCQSWRTKLRTGDGWPLGAL